MKNGYSLGNRTAAWGVHLFTATGLLAGFMALLAVQDHDWQRAAAWLLVALVIDGVDGTLARLARVSEVLPDVSGKQIDFVIDFFNYAIVPAFLLYESDLITGTASIIAVGIILLVSAIYYGIEGMVSEDNYFVGFPVMWNVAVLFQLFIMQASSPVNFCLVLLLGILHFVPVKFAYPSQNKHARIPTLLVTVGFVIALGAATYYYPAPPLWCILTAYLAVGYFAVLAVFDTWFR